MKSWHYVLIFGLVFVVIGGLLLYNAATVYEVPQEDVVVTKSVITPNEEEQMIVNQKSINVLVDEDFEMDESDVANVMEMGVFDDIDGVILVDEDLVEF
jgi:hypothetical protein